MHAPPLQMTGVVLAGVVVVVVGVVVVVVVLVLVVVLGPVVLVNPRQKFSGAYERAEVISQRRVNTHVPSQPDGALV